MKPHDRNRFRRLVRDKASLSGAGEDDVDPPLHEFRQQLPQLFGGRVAAAFHAVPTAICPIRGTFPVAGCASTTCGVARKPNARTTVSAARIVIDASTTGC